MTFSLTLEQITALVRPEKTAGTAVSSISGIAALEEARVGDLSFLGNPKYKTEVPGTDASMVLLPLDYIGEPREGQLYLFVKNPSYALALLCDQIERALWKRPAPGIHPTALIDPSARLGENLHIGPYCIIEAEAEIGDNTVLEAYCHIGRAAKIGSDNWFRPRASVTDYCETGTRVQLFIGAVIGGEGFGFETIEGAHRKIPQIGNVVLGDDVEVGANSTIDRARFSTTRIGDGTKIDNLVQIGHNCQVGKHCILCSQSGMAGSTTLEDYVVLAGQAGLAGHLRIGKGTQVGAQAGVLSDIPAGQIVLDSPAIPLQAAKKLMVLKQRLPDLFARVKSLEQTVERLRQPQ